MVRGFLNRLIDAFREDEEDLEYEETDLVIPEASNARFRRAEMKRRLANFGLPEQMNRADWEYVIRVFRECFLPDPTQEAETRFLDILQLCDKVIERAIQDDGRVYFPPARMQTDPLVNLLLHKNTGNTYGMLLDLLIALISYTEMYRVNEHLIIQIMEMWELARRDLVAADSTYIDKGPLQPVEVIVARPVKISAGDINKSQGEKIIHNKPESYSHKEDKNTSDTNTQRMHNDDLDFGFK